MRTVEEVIESGYMVVITFKDSNGKYHHSVKSFKSIAEYESYRDTREKEKGWKEIGTEPWLDKIK